ncbi:MAG: hypothetical protein LBJ92_01655 [Holosporales bacterium]|jgi:hypothetical protein|nr:hypothetical protein [Holosporales bacterium]
MKLNKARLHYKGIVSTVIMMLGGMSLAQATRDPRAGMPPLPEVNLVNESRLVNPDAVKVTWLLKDQSVKKLYERGPFRTLIIKSVIAFGGGNGPVGNALTDCVGQLDALKSSLSPVEFLLGCHLFSGNCKIHVITDHEAQRNGIRFTLPEALANVAGALYFEVSVIPDIFCPAAHNWFIHQRYIQINCQQIADPAILELAHSIMGTLAHGPEPGSVEYTQHRLGSCPPHVRDWLIQILQPPRDPKDGFAVVPSDTPFDEFTTVAQCVPNSDETKLSEFLPRLQANIVLTEDPFTLFLRSCFPELDSLRISFFTGQVEHIVGQKEQLELLTILLNPPIQDSRQFKSFTAQQSPQHPFSPSKRQIISFVYHNYGDASKERASDGRWYLKLEDRINLPDCRTRIGPGDPDAIAEFTSIVQEIQRTARFLPRLNMRKYQNPKVLVNVVGQIPAFDALITELQEQRDRVRAGWEPETPE